MSEEGEEGEGGRGGGEGSIVTDKGLQELGDSVHSSIHNVKVRACSKD